MVTKKTLSDPAIIESYMKRNKLRVQFLRYKEEITALVLQGYTYSSIHKKFYEEGKITTKYNFFAKYLEREFGPIKGTGKKRTKLVIETQQKVQD